MRYVIFVQYDICFDNYTYRVPIYIFMCACVCICVSLCASVCAIYVLFKIIFIEKILENFICKMQQKFNLVYLFHDSCHLTVQTFHNGVRKTF